MSEPRFKVGDIVRVKSLEEINCIRGNIEATFVSNMEQFCGKMFQICHSATSEYGYRYDLDDADGWLYGESVLDPALIIGGLARIKTFEEIAKEYPSEMSGNNCGLGAMFTLTMRDFSNGIVRVDRISLAKSYLEASQVNLSLLNGNNAYADIFNKFAWSLYMVEYYEGEEKRENQISKEPGAVANIVSNLKANARFKLMP